MQKLLASAIILAFIGAATPAAYASETVTEAYIASVGYYAGPACGSIGGVINSPCYLGLILCPTQPDGTNCDLGGEWCFDVDDDGNDDVCETLPSTDVGMEAGGASFLAAATYQSVSISSDDAFFGSDAAMSVCLWHPDGDNTCSQGIQDSTGNIGGAAQCGTSIVTSTVFDGFYSNDASAFFFDVFVGEDLSLCGASQGNAFATFF